MVRILFVVLLMISFLTGSYVYAQDNDSLLPDEQDMYVAGVIAELSEARKYLERIEPYFEREDQVMYQQYNEELLEVAKNHVKVMERLLKAIRKDDSEGIQKYTRQKDQIVHEKNIAELRREMAVQLVAYKQRVQAFPDNFKLKNSVENLRHAYRELIDAQIMLYQAQMQLKEVAERKQKAVDLLEMYLSDEENPPAEE